MRKALAAVMAMFVMAGAAFAQVPSSNHVFVVFEENHGYSQVVGNTADMPYLNSLISKYGLATQFYGNATGSIPDYFMATSGQALETWSVQNVDNIVRELLAVNKTWKSYAESLPYAGYTGGASYPYTREHNPFALYTDVVNSSTQVKNLVPFSPNFAADRANNALPNYSFIIPNQNNNAHDCPAGMSTCTDSQKLQAADLWLKNNIDPLIQSAAFQQDGMLIIAFDEGSGDSTNGGGRVAWVVIGPQVTPGYRSSFYYYANQSTLRLTCEALGIALASCPGAAATAPGMAEFFGATGAITGTVVDTDTHAPIAGATVSSSNRSTTTASDGTYTLANLAPGTVTVTASATGYSSSSASVTVAAGGSTNQNFFLAANASSGPGNVSGKVVDISTGNGISGAKVSYSGGSTTADTGGNFSLANVAAGTYSVSASASGYFTEANSVTVSAGTTAATTIQLPTGGILAGTVTGTGGAALAGATVAISGGKVATSKTVTTNSSGAYNTSWVPVGTYSVTVSASGYSTQTKSATVNTGATTSSNFAMSAGSTSTGAITGTVLDSSTNAAIAGATVSYSGGSTTTTANGTYTLSNLPAGTVTVTASASGHTGASANVSVTSGATATQNFSLTPTSGGAGTLSGKVTDISTGYGISGATVTYSGGSTTTTSGGNYSFSSVAPGTYAVGAAASGYFKETNSGTVTSGTTTTVNIQLPTGGKVAGTVTNTSGAVISGASVSIKGGSVATTVNTSTNSSGVYNSNWVPVGSYAVTVSASGHTTQSKTVNVTTGATAALNFTMQ